MPKELNEAIRLLESWNQFKQAKPQGELLDYADYIRDQDAGNVPEKHAPNDKSIPTDNYIGFLLGRLSRFTSMWGKKLFDKSRLRSLDEYGILKFIQRSPGGRKSDIVFEAMLEPTTSFEIIKRLKKMGLVTDQPDENDRRTKRVFITDAGHEALEQIDQQLDGLSQLLLGHLSEGDKAIFLKILVELDGFHQSMYENSRDDSLDNLVSEYLPTPSTH
jgi:DNA-binding MarR family transcriptional regulator